MCECMKERNLFFLSCSFLYFAILYCTLLTLSYLSLPVEHNCIQKSLKCIENAEPFLFHKTVIRRCQRLMSIWRRNDRCNSEARGSIMYLRILVSQPK